MNGLLPATIAGRTILALLIGLTLSHAASVMIYRSDRHHAISLISGHKVAEQVVAITRLFDDLPETDRERLVEAVNSPTMRVWSERSSSIQSGEDSQARSIRDKLTELLGRSFQGRIVVATTSDASQSALAHDYAPMVQDESRLLAVTATSFVDGVQVAIRLDDATWLRFAAQILRGASLWSLEFLWSMGIMVAAIVPFSIWIIHLATKPLAAFAGAAGQLGLNMDAPPLPERGPREVVRASRAFNEMQARIRVLIRDRTQMLAAISHDLRTPITRLRLRAEFIDDREQKDKMLDDLEEMETMVLSVLSFAREDAATEPLKAVDLGSLVQSICDDMQDAGKQVELSQVTRLPYVCRPSALKRVFTNVIENAVNYGKVARVDMLERPDGIEVCIDDDGPGISEAEFENVFTPFYRIESSRSRQTGGTGLGLAVARSVIRSHGGDIWLENHAGGGLRVHIALPKQDRFVVG